MNKGQTFTAAVPEPATLLLLLAGLLLFGIFTWRACERL
ncbi:MAG: PEP-CTERM sorting domain-containing protein [Thermodesulfobacteriota bacterium]